MPQREVLPPSRLPSTSLPLSKHVHSAGRRREAVQRLATQAPRRRRGRARVDAHVSVREEDLRHGRSWGRCGTCEHRRGDAGPLAKYARFCLAPLAPSAPAPGLPSLRACPPACLSPALPFKHGTDCILGILSTLYLMLTKASCPLRTGASSTAPAPLIAFYKSDRL